MNKESTAQYREEVKDLLREVTVLNQTLNECLTTHDKISNKVIALYEKLDAELNNKDLNSG